MKALTLHQPWSWAIAHAGKRVENRTWAPPASVIGQRVAIHAGLRLDKAGVDSVGAILVERLLNSFVEGPDGVQRAPSDLAHAAINLDRLSDDVSGFVHGAVESVATIAGYVEDRGGEFGSAFYSTWADGVSPLRVSSVVRSPWWIGPFGWVLTDVIALPEPVPCKGAQGLWTLPADVESAVLAQLGGEHG